MRVGQPAAAVEQRAVDVDRQQADRRAAVYFLSAAVQLSSTVIGMVAGSSRAVFMRNVRLSGETSYEFRSRAGCACVWNSAVGVPNASRGRDATPARSSSCRPPQDRTTRGRRAAMPVDCRRPSTRRGRPDRPEKAVASLTAKTSARPSGDRASAPSSPMPGGGPMVKRTEVSLARTGGEVRTMRDAPAPSRNAPISIAAIAMTASTARDVRGDRLSTVIQARLEMRTRQSSNGLPPQPSGPSTLIKDHLAGGASRLAALLLPQIPPVLPVFSVVAPCQPGAALRDLRRESHGRDTSDQQLAGSSRAAQHSI